MNEYEVRLFEQILTENKLLDRKNLKLEEQIKNDYWYQQYSELKKSISQKEGKEDVSMR